MLAFAQKLLLASWTFLKLKKKSVAEKSLLSEVIKAVHILLVVPATEISFSSMGRVKAYLRSAMPRKRLNALMLLHVHKDYTQIIWT